MVLLLQNGFLRVAVGMPVTRHPPHGSVHAALPHTALPLDSNTKSFIRIFMTYFR